MPDLDQELLERVARWCAEAGRPAASAEIRRALEPLGWDELLAARALLADPPPASPLGPFALADVARGVPAGAAAERERRGEYPSPEEAEDAAPGAAAAPGPAPAAAPRKPGGRRGPKVQGPVIRRARDAAPPPVPPSPSVPLADELFLPEGRTVLERLIRRQGARRHALVAALAQGWRTVSGRPIDDDLAGRLLDHHGLARAFARREHDELLHALRAAGGMRSAAAARLGVDRESFDAALARTGAAAEAERIREARRGEARARATLAERVRLRLTDPARLDDLGLLQEFEDDLRRRLPEHVRAVGAGGGPLLLALGQSLSILPAEAQALLERLGVPLDRGPGRAPSGAGAPPPRARPRPGFGPAGATGGMRPPRRPASGRAGAGARPERRGPPGVPGSVGPPRERRERAEGGLGPPRPRRDRVEGSGPARERREGGARGFGSPRPRPDRKEGFGPPRGPRESGARGSGSPRPRPDRQEGFGPPRGRTGRPEGTGRPGPRRGDGGPGGARSGRPGGPRGKPPPRGPRRGGA